jgi:hypothetical protein
MSVIIPWVVIAVILVVVGIVLIIAAVKSHFAKVWKMVLGVIAVATICLGLYWLLFLVGIGIP